MNRKNLDKIGIRVFEIFKENEIPTKFNWKVSTMWYNWQYIEMNILF
jgi:hypothetical protein